MKRLILLAVMVLMTLVGMVGFSRADNAVSVLQATANTTDGAASTLQATVNDGVPVKPKVYYLTKNTFDGGDAIMACDSGFHMASITEIQDPSNLQYATRSTTVYDSLVDDPGLGPPLKQMGWVRSGVYPPSVFLYDCGDFRDKYDIQLGTTLALYDLPFNSEAARPASYPTKGSYTTHYTCSHSQPVWCAEDQE